MGIKFTRDVEKDRIDTKLKKSKSHWELLSTTSIVEAIHFAKDHGWEDKKVQVKAYRIADDVVEYNVEVFEKDCTCPDLLRFSDYFSPQGVDLVD